MDGAIVKGWRRVSEAWAYSWLKSLGVTDEDSFYVRRQILLRNIWNYADEKSKVKISFSEKDGSFMALASDSDLPKIAITYNFRSCLRSF